jgi:hypothetical protein
VETVRVVFLAIIFLCILFLVAPPVSALTGFEKITAIQNTIIGHSGPTTDFTWDGSRDKRAVYYIVLTVPTNGNVQFTLFYGTTGSVSGSASSMTSWIQEGDLLPKTTSTVTLDGTSKSYTYWDVDGHVDLNIVQHYTNTSTKTRRIAIFSSDYGKYDNALAVTYDLPAGSQSATIYKIHFTSSAPIEIEYRHAPADIVLKAVTNTGEGGVAEFLEEIKQIMLLATATFNSALEFGASLFYWLRFFFIDNLMLIIGLYLSVSMALAARASRGHIGKFFRVFLNDQRKLFEFILSLWRMLLESIGTIRGWFRI